MGTTIKIHRGDDSGAFGGHLFSITDTESLYDIKTVEIGFGVVKLRYNKPDEGDLFPIVVDLDVVQTNVNGVGDYPISVTAYDSNNRRLLIDQSCTLSVVPNSESIPTPYELTVLFDIADVMPTSSDEPEPYDPGESPRRGKTYYNTETDRLLVYNGDSYDVIAYSDDAPSAHTHTGDQVTSKVSTAETADKLGSTTIGSTKNPIYLNSGVPTACYDDTDRFEITGFTMGEPSNLIAGNNATEGFFGEVTGANFIYPWEVLAQLKDMDMTQITTKQAFIDNFASAYGSSIAYAFSGNSYTALGVSDNLEVEWLKFYDHGKILFVPKRPLLNNITWDEIKSLLDGSVSVGKDIKIDMHRINSNYGTSYNGGRYATLKCRLLTGGNHQPFIYGNFRDSGLNGVELGRGSEWNRLMNRICAQVPTDKNSGAMSSHSGGKQIGKNWAEYTAQQLGFNSSNDRGRVSLCQEYMYYTSTISINGRGSEYGVGFIYYYGISSRNNGLGFRPVLVLGED